MKIIKNNKHILSSIEILYLLKNQMHVMFLPSISSSIINFSTKKYVSKFYIMFTH